MKIYIAGPYSAATEQERANNVIAAIDAAISLFSRGHYPYIPHLTHYVDERAKATGIDMQWEDYIRWDIPWLYQCDALFFLAPSRGALLELELASELGKKVFYSIDEVPVVSRPADEDYGVIRRLVEKFNQ